MKVIQTTLPSTVTMEELRGHSLREELRDILFGASKNSEDEWEIEMFGFFSFRHSCLK